MDPAVRLLALAATVLPLVAHAAAASLQLVTPRYISVPGGESQDVSVRVLDATGRPAVGEPVTLSNDACGYFSGTSGGFFTTVTSDSNGVATTRFTASNPPGITCWIHASSGSAPFVTVDVLTYRVSEVAVVAGPDPANPPPGPYTFRVTPTWGAYSLRNVDVTARVIAGTGTATLSAPGGNTGDGGNVAFTVTPSSLTGSYTIEATYRTQVKKVALGGSTSPWQDMWWAGTGENGWGLSIVQHGSQFFAVIYAYDAAGKPTWFFVPGGTWDAAHTTFSGDAYVPTGSPFYAYDPSRIIVGPSVGRIRIAFTGVDAATLDYSLEGQSGTKSLSRFTFGPVQTAPLAGLSDMWWGGASQNGWGVAVLQQYATLFIVWYTYDASGAPTWYYAPAGNWTDGQTYSGRVYRTTSSSWLGTTYDPSRFQSIDAGSFRIRFTGDNATFDYSVDGHTASIPLSRYAFSR